MVLSTEAAAARLAARIKSSAPGAPMLRAAVVASNPILGEPAGTVGVYLEGGTVEVPALGGPGLAVGDTVVVWTGTPLVCVEVAGRELHGSETISLPNGSPSTTRTVTFPAGRFAQAPRVTLTNCGGTGSSNVILQAQAAPTTSGFTILVLHRDGGANFGSGQSVLVQWSAS